MEFNPDQPGQAAGLVLWMDKDAYVTLSVRGADVAGEQELVFKCPMSDRSFKVSCGLSSRLVWMLPLTDCLFQETKFKYGSDSGPIEFGVRASKASYEFWFKCTGDAKKTSVGRVETHLFQPLFTGVHIGLYAQGAGGSPCLTPAYFKYARWEVAAC